MAYIGWCDVLGSLRDIFLLLGFTVFHTYSFITLPYDVKGQTMSIWFGVFIVLSWINLIPVIKKLGIVIKYFGNDISDNIWANLTALSKRYQLTSFVNAVIAIYFFIKIGPFFNSCGIYTSDGTKLACISVQIIAFGVFFSLCVIGIIIVGYSICMLVLCGVLIYDREHRSHSNIQRFDLHVPAPNLEVPAPNLHVPAPNLEVPMYDLEVPMDDFEDPIHDVGIQEQMLNHPMTVSATKFLEKYIPIDHPEDSDKCLVCLETPEENSKVWTSLDCGHRSHQDCLLEWYRYEKSCPVCRRPIEVVTV